MNRDVREVLCDMGHEEAIVFDGPDYDDAIIGVTDEGKVIYDYDAMVLSLMKRGGISEDEAIDFIEYNAIRSLPYAGPGAPIIMHRVQTE